MDRKGFIKTIGRATVAVGLGAGAVYLCAGKDGCTKVAAECAQCASLPDCSLPQARDARRARDEIRDE